MHNITLSEAGRRLGGRSCEYVKGACDMIGIPLIAIGTARAMTAEDFDRLASHARLHRPRVKVHATAPA